MIVLNQVPLSFSLEGALSVGGLGRVANKISNLDNLLDQCRNLVKPSAIYTYLKIDRLTDDVVFLEGNKRLSSQRLVQELKCATELAPFIATIGPDLERKVSEIAANQLLDSWVLDNFGTYTLRLLNKHIEERIRREKGWKVSKFNPGSTPTWNLEEQEVLFGIFSRKKVEDSIGVTLSDKFVMRPRKSLSGVIAQTENGYHNCQECRKECEYRQMPYKGHG